LSTVSHLQSAHHFGQPPREVGRWYTIDELVKLWNSNRTSVRRALFLVMGEKKVIKRLAGIDPRG